MIRRFPLPPLILLALVVAQITRLASAEGVLVFRDTAGLDVASALKLERGVEAAEANSVKLNAAIRDAGDQVYSFCFPAGDWYFGRDTVNKNINGCCILMNRSSGQAILGKGLGGAGGEVDPNGVMLNAVRLIYNGPKIVLENTTHSLSGATITFTSGYTPVSQDVGATVQITGGTGANQSFYVVESVRGNTITLDRAPGGSATNLAGLMTYTLIRDPGYGTRYVGITLNGAATSGTIDCHVGIHFVSNAVVNSGKANVEQCQFSDFTSAILTGKDMRKAYDGAGASYTGDGDNHCDHLTSIKCFWWRCRTCIYLRTGQSVCHTIIHPRVFGRFDGTKTEFIYAERGGLVDVLGGGFSGPDTTALRLSANGANVASFNFVSCRFDSETHNPRWLKMDIPFSGSNKITFSNCYICEGVTDYAYPLWECKGGTTLVLDACRPVRTNSLTLLSVNGGGGLYWVPHVEVRSCTLMNSGGTNPAFDKPFAIRNPASPNTNASFPYPQSITFTGANSNYTGMVLYERGRYLTEYDDDSTPIAAEWIPDSSLPTR